jgi:pimeloyl-ACP methyl ester carboxylesterase
VVGKVGAEQVVLVGHSMGAPVAVEAARQMPARVRGVVAVDSLRNIDGARIMEEVAEFLAPFDANFVDATTDFVHSMFIADSDPALVERIVANMSSAPPDVATSALREVFMNSQRLKATLLEQSIPMAVINSDYQPCDIQGLESYGISVSMMSDVGHFVMIEDAKTFNRLLEEAVGPWELQ